MAITVVTGPPCAGKSTYVATHRDPGDVVIDFDVIAQAFGSSGHDHSPVHVAMAQDAWRSAVTLAPMLGAPVWIVHAQPGAGALRNYQRWGARVLVLDPGEAVVRERAARERPAVSVRFIDRWYS